MFGKPGFPLSDVPLQAIAADVEAGRYNAKPSRLFRFEDIQEAHRLMESNEAKRQTRGGFMSGRADATEPARARQHREHCGQWNSRCYMGGLMVTAMDPSPAIKLLIADVDGTLVTLDKSLTARTLESVDRLRLAGVGFAII